MRYLLILVVLLFSSQFSIAQDKPDGLYQEYYDSGELKKEGRYKNNKRVGEWKSYYKNGQVSKLYSYNNGKYNKAQISYFESGIVSNKTEKEDGVYLHSSFYKSGKLKYKRQDISGYYKSFYESGSIKVEANYKEKELIGEWKKYYENGQLEWLVNYKDGYREGIYKQYYNNGEIKLEGTNSWDRKDGEEKRYLLGNVLEWKGKYKDGLLHKTWIKYNESGEKLEKIKFKNGVASISKYQKVIIPTDVASGVIERMPIYPGCENFLTNTELKKCMNYSVVRLINKNFNLDLAADLDLEGKHRIIVNFKINKEGYVTKAIAKAPHAALEAEAIRVIQLIPKVIPGYQRDKPVIIPYSIPIVFEVF